MAWRDVRDWGRNKRLLTALGATEIASSAKTMRTLLGVVCSGKGVSLLGPVPALDVWLGFYRNHRLLRDTLADGWEPVKAGQVPSSLKLAGVQDGIRFLSRMPVDDRIAFCKKEWETTPREKIQEAAAWSARYWKKRISQQEAFVKAEAGQGEFPCDPVAGKMMRTGEMQFLCRVWMPCFMLFRTYPTRLFASARRGNIDSLCDLVKLDKAVVGEPRIAAHIHRWANRDRQKFAKFSRAYSKWPRVPSLKELKYRLGALIIAGFGKFEGELTAPDVSGLFDALDKTPSGRLDGDPDGDFGDVFPDSIAKHFRRERERWETVVIKADKS